MNNLSKLNLLLQQLPPGVVILSSWLCRQGYPYELQQRYRKSGWLKSVGRGAMKRVGENLTLNGALYAMQAQAHLDVHIGGRTALGLLGLAQYIEIQGSQSLLFIRHGTSLPSWLFNNQWDSIPVIINTSFLPAHKGLIDYDASGFSIRISGAARAYMECLELAPNKFDLTEAGELMEGLNALQPETVQSLLESCTSVKVKRLFLYFAEKSGHNWLKYLQPANINLGKGKRSILPNGVFVPRYNITLPKHLV
jgi:hypothetical protein